MMFRVEFLIYLFSTVIFSSSSNCDFSGHFVKTDHSFERITQNDTLSSWDSLPKMIPDYISTTQTLLDMLIQDNSSVKAENLNKFNLGLHQFYLSLAYELDVRRSAIGYPKLEFNDPVHLPNATAFGKPDICFHNVRVYGFPGFRKWSQKLETEPGDPYVQFYKIQRTFSSDAMIFTGYFEVYPDNFFFAYYTRSNTLKTIQTKWRSNEGTILPKRTVDLLHFKQEDLSHTYQSSEKMFSIVNATLYKKLISITEQIWLPRLISSMDVKLYPESIRDTGVFASIYRSKVLECLVESAKKYVTLTSPSDTFEASSLHATALSKSNRTFHRWYENQKVEGVMNFVEYYTNETKIHDYMERKSVIRETVSFWYSNRNPAFVKFSIIDQEGRIFEKKYSILTMNITCAFEAIADRVPFKVSRKKDAFSNGSGFLILFDLLDFDPALEFVVLHIGNEMAKSIAKVLDSEKDVFKMEFE